MSGRTRQGYPQNELKGGLLDPIRWVVGMLGSIGVIARKSDYCTSAGFFSFFSCRLSSALYCRSSNQILLDHWAPSVQGTSQLLFSVLPITTIRTMMIKTTKKTTKPTVMWNQIYIGLHIL